MKILLGIVMFLAMMVGPAQADTPNCVTLAEFNTVIVGQRMSYVHHVWDDTGWVATKNNQYQFRFYKSCNPDYEVTASYYKNDGIWLLRSKDRTAR